jgi:sugar phosphate isomerase/epimerase
VTGAASASPTISFMSANLVAREAGWRIRDWAEGERATNEAFEPLASFPDRFGALLGQVRSLGFDTLDVWTAHLNPHWASADHLAVARRLLDHHGLRVATLAGAFGSDVAELERSCGVAVAIGAPVLGGLLDVPADDPEVAELLRRHGLRLGLENHPGDETPASIARSIPVGTDGVVGTTVDTGWWGTHGVDADGAIEELAPHVVHVHLKDVRRAGAHETCPWGEGVVPIRQCVNVLRRLGYAGAISVEHEPYDHDPSEACRAMRVELQRWLAEPRP